MSFRMTCLFLYLVLNSIILSNSQEEEDVIVMPILDKNLNHYCSDNVYHFQFEVKFSKELDKVIPFEMTIPLPNRLSFKCIINGPKSNIDYFHSFSNYVWSLPDNSRIELPYSFPNIEGIRWDYDLFLRKIYRYLWRTIGNCGLEYELNPSMNSMNINNQQTQQTPNNPKKAEIVADVEEISGGKCYSSQNDFSFKMKLKLYEGEIFEELKKVKAENKATSIKLLHGVYVPVLIGDKKQRGKTTFRKDFEYKYANCNTSNEITQDNYNAPEGIILTCHLPISTYLQFKGPLQIKPFSDHLYINKTDSEGNTNINEICIKFEILSGFETFSSTPNLRNLNNLQSSANPFFRQLQVSQNIVKEPNFLILDSNLNIYICPDKPIFTVKNYNDGIVFGGLNTSGSKYLFLLIGYLSNGYEFVNETLTPLDMTKEEIKFYLKVTDNLESPDSRRKSVKCSIPTGTSINKNELIEVKCIGSRPPLPHNNTDLLLNWNIQENNNFENVVIRWPYDLTKKKHIFYYNIKGLSVKRDNFGCFENKFYFYLYVYDLKEEPQISFNLPLVYPKYTHAECKLYNSVTFKCMIDLRLKKLSKGGKIILPHEISEYLANNENNIVLYQVNNSTLFSSLDFILPVQETCGDLKLVGALKDVGYSYFQVIMIIVGVTVGLALCFLGVGFCVIYEITHRNRKGPYHKYVEEKTLPNTSVSATKPPV